MTCMCPRLPTRPLLHLKCYFLHSKCSLIEVMLTPTAPCPGMGMNLFLLSSSDTCLCATQCQTDYFHSHFLACKAVFDYCTCCYWVTCHALDLDLKVENYCSHRTSDVTTCSMIIVWYLIPAPPRLHEFGVWTCLVVADSGLFLSPKSFLAVCFYLWISFER